jgi:DNA-binding transcriptional regulator YdaS (Cro superfamily)
MKTTTSHAEKLRAYLRNLSPEDRDLFASTLGTSTGYLRKAASINSLLSPALCVQIERVTEGHLSRRDLRPDDWHLIWPELAAVDRV